MNDLNEYTRITKRVVDICIICNFCLCLIKIIGGLLSNSKAIVADGINSVFDVVTGLIIIVGSKFASKTADDNHPYGHERLESVASVVLAIVLFVTAIFTGHTAIEDLSSGQYLYKEVPGLLSMVCALISIITKILLFFFTKYNAERINSLPLKAEAYDNMSDVISTTGALIGVMLTRYGLMMADLIASLIVCTFIINTAYKVFKEAMEQLVDKSCDEKLYAEMKKCIEDTEDVLGIDMLQVRLFGNRYYVDLEIREDGSLTLEKAHNVAEIVHDKIEKQFPLVKHIMVHVNPVKVDERTK